LTLQDDPLEDVANLLKELKKENKRAKDENVSNLDEFKRAQLELCRAQLTLCNSEIENAELRRALLRGAVEHFNCPMQ